MNTLEHCHLRGASREPRIHYRGDNPVMVLRTDGDEIDAADRALIARAPDLRDALREMLGMFGGDMNPDQYQAYQRLLEDL